jgi:hypothetical protein
MSGNMLDKLFADAMLVTDERVRQLDLDEADAELLAQLRSTHASSLAGVMPVPTAGIQRRPVRIAVGSFVAALVAIIAIVVLSLDPGDDPKVDVTPETTILPSTAPPPTTAPALPEDVAMAERTPLLLVREEGAAVIDVVQQDGRGTLIFWTFSGRLQLNWAPESEYDLFHRQAGPDGSEITVAGRKAMLYVRSGDGAFGSTEYLVIVEPEDGQFVFLIEDGMDIEDAFLSTVATIEKVSVEEWLAALPPEAVLPSEKEGSVAQLMAGVPLPPGLDLEELGRSAHSTDEMFAWVLEMRVACGWAEVWMDAHADQDDATAQLAIDSLTNWPSWPAARARARAGGDIVVPGQLLEAMLNGTLTRGSTDLEPCSDEFLLP